MKKIGMMWEMKTCLPVYIPERSAGMQGGMKMWK
jgi:hypothetical protein